MNRIFALPFIFLIYSATTLASESADHNFDVHTSLVYSAADPICQMDLFIPAGLTDAMPCVLVIQGGGFRAQNGQKFKPFAEYLARHGIAAALIGYRGQPDHTYTKTIADVKTAVRFIRQISADHGIDPDRIGAMGRSAGATLAVLAATTNGNPSFVGRGEHSSYTSRLQAIVGIAGVYDFVARFEDDEQRALQPNLDSKILANGAWIGAEFSPENRHWQRASARTHLDAGDPPILLLQSRDDGTVPWPQSRNFHTALQEAGIDSHFHLAETGGHSGPGDSKARMVAFFKEILVTSNSSP